MGKIYTMDKCLIGGEAPQLNVAGKLYAVDTRKSTYDRIQAEVSKLPPDQESEQPNIIVKHALGEDAYHEIVALDASMSFWTELTLGIQAAMIDIPLEEARRRFQRA